MLTALIYSEKGGVGKSSLSNILCFGASLAKEGTGYSVVLAHMDNRAPIEPEDDRGYEIIDLRNEKQAVTVIQRAKESDEKGLLVIDVGANKTRLVERFAKYCDIVLVPMESDHDSVRLALEAIKNTSLQSAPAGIHVVTNRTPAPKSISRKKYEARTAAVPRSYFLYQFPQLSAVSDLGMPTPLTSQAKSRLRYQSLRLFSTVESTILSA